MSNIVMPPTSKIIQIAEMLEKAVGQFLSAHQTALPLLGKYESGVEACLLFRLVIRDIEAIVVLARTDLVLLPSASVLARTVFEVAVKAAWMVQPDDPFDREVRWLAHLAEEERLLKGIAESVVKFGGNPIMFSERLAPIREFRAGVAKALPPGYSELPGNPSVEKMLEKLGQKQTYPIYRLLAQHVHGGHASTWLYRRNLGTHKEFGEFISPGDWYLPLWTAWKNLQIFGEYLLEHSKAERSEFLTPEEIGSLDLAFHQLGRHNTRVN